MTKRHTPPGRKSKVRVVVVNPFGPHHCARCFGSLHTENTRARGALSTRLPMIERGSFSRSMLLFTATRLLPFVLFVLLTLRLNCPKIVVEPIETLFPKAAVFLEPVIGFPERLHVDATWPHLRIAGPRDEARALQHLQMFRNRGQAHVKRLRELQHGRFAERESREDCAPCGSARAAKVELRRSAIVINHPVK